MAGIFEIDKLQTERINQTVESSMCECDACQWYYQYMKQLPPPAKAFFEESGIAPEKCQELWGYHPNDNGYTHYSGYFYIAVKEAETAKPFHITRDWRTLDYGVCRFRVRLEDTNDGKPILGFEASLPVENPPPEILK